VRDSVGETPYMDDAGPAIGKQGRRQDSRQESKPSRSIVANQGRSNQQTRRY